MAVRSTTDILASLREHLGDDTSDQALALVEDVSDTLASLTNSGDGIDWKAKYDENDASWRQKYRDRFFGNSDTPDDTNPTDDKPTKPRTFDELFKEE